jgi:hypothetical protein
MLTANLKFRTRKIFPFFLFLQCFTLKIELNDSYSRSKNLRTLLLKTNMFNYVPIKHKQMSFVPNGGKFKLYNVLNGLIFPTPTQPRISFERAILIAQQIKFTLFFCNVQIHSYEGQLRSSRF